MRDTFDWVHKWVTKRRWTIHISPPERTHCHSTKIRCHCRKPRVRPPTRGDGSRAFAAQLGRDDLVECAELGTAELVANAILHGMAPISVRVRGTATHPRIEVTDGSPQAPVPPAHAADPDDFLATFGRGLSIVAMSAIAWGASIEGDGKVVWFEPASGVGAHEAAEPVFDSHAEPDAEARSDHAVRVRLLGLDVAPGNGVEPPVRRPAPRAPAAGRRPPGRLSAGRQPVGDVHQL